MARKINMSSSQTTTKQRRKSRADPSLPTSQSQDSQPRLTTLLSRAWQCLATLLYLIVWLICAPFKLFVLLCVGYYNVMFPKPEARTDFNVQTVPNDGLGMRYRSLNIDPIPNDVFGLPYQSLNVDRPIPNDGLGLRYRSFNVDPMPVRSYGRAIEGEIQAAPEAAQNSRQLGEIEESQVLNVDVVETDKASDTKLASSKADALYNITSTESLN